MRKMHSNSTRRVWENTRHSFILDYIADLKLITDAIFEVSDPKTLYDETFWEKRSFEIATGITLKSKPGV